MRIWHKISKVSDGRLCQLANDDECSLQEQPDDMMQEMDFFPADAVEQRAGRNPCHSGDNDGQHAAALDYGEQRICQKQQTSGFDTNGGGISWENAFFFKGSRRGAACRQGAVSRRSILCGRSTACGIPGSLLPQGEQH